MINAFMPNSFMQTVFMHTPSGKNWIMIDCCKNKQIDRSSDDLYCTNSINLTVTSHKHHFKTTKNPSNSVILLTNSVNTSTCRIKVIEIERYIIIQDIEIYNKGEIFHSL